MDSRTALVTLARFAQGQWGMVTSAQAVEAGVSYMQLKRMTEAGLLVRLRLGTLAPYEVTWADGLPVTTALRTLTDLLADGAEAGEAGGFLAEALDRRMLRVDNVIPELARFAHRYGCPDGDGQALVRALIDQAAATQPGLWDRERAVSDLARELLQLSNDQLRSLRSLAGAAKEPAIVALLSRLATDRGEVAREERPAGSQRASR